MMNEFYELFLLQESVSDFFWYYSGKDVIDVHGQHNFSKAIGVSKQVFNTLTEYIQVSQGSCAVLVLDVSCRASKLSAYWI